ncbi:PIG-L deacetylase family protein [Cupriavidus pauculus]|uniref:PIG-L deacetylase family protein n=1 Tax=Cupriavidus pauculus TaxID=82633 RepID=UPI001EE1FAA1|nr:PIG-L family deacetylase [Cupriavidus pauculus]GJG94249.1 PIG-L family deacetylase [Cupriavidus pauculus]
MPLLQIPEPLTVISPHLDDAVFSCGALLAAAQGAVVLTVLAGIPDAALPLPDWDRAAGFTSTSQAVVMRRREDARSLGRLGARPEWLGFLDGQYRTPHAAEDIMRGLAASPALQRGGTVVAPMGLFHSDHELVARACLLLRGTIGAMRTAQAVQATHAADDGMPTPPVQWLFYEDAIHRRMAGVVQDRLMEWWQAGLIATPVHVPLARWQGIKMEAVEAYESQLPLFSAGQLADIGAPERYWSVDMAPANAPAPAA